MSTVFRKAISLASLLLFSTLTQASPLADEQIKTLIEKADSGDLPAKIELANHYYSGTGTEKDLVKAATLYQQLAQDEVAQAQMTLALMYIRGEGVEQNNQEALRWLTAAAEQRLAPAQYYLGVAYAEGHGVAVDNVEAYMWYEIAAAMDYKNAIEAEQELAKKMSKEDILAAEQKATQWWMRFHH